MYTVLRGGCHARHPQGFFLSREEGIDHYVLLLVHTPGEFYIDGVHTSALPGQGILFAPYTPYRYESPQGSYMDDWLHFSISSSAHFFSGSPYGGLHPSFKTAFVGGFLHK